MRKKFKITKDGLPLKLPEKGMIVMNQDGVFFLVVLEDYYQSTRKLSNFCGYYDIEWRD